MLVIRLLGRFELRKDAELVVIPSRQAQSLLAYLALTPGVSHRREKLAGLLWPDIPETDARRNLRGVHYQIRKAIRVQGPLRADDIGIEFVMGPDIWVDVHALTQNLSSHYSPDELIQVVSVYGGELLPGFYDEWVTLEREHLQSVFENRISLLLNQLSEARRWKEVLEWGDRWIALVGQSEPACRALMLAYSGLGDLSGVGHAFQRCVESLEKDLGVEPSDETRQLFTQLTQKRSAPKPVIETSGKNELPPEKPPFKGLQVYDEPDAALFFGREDLTVRLLERLGILKGSRSEGECLLVIVGASGCGKSSLVRAGLAPTIRRSMEAEEEGCVQPKPMWDIHILTPSNHPLESLAASLTRSVESVTAAATLIDDMICDPRCLRLYLRKLPAPLFLIVDQLEELFTLCRDEAERRAFIDNILSAVEGADCKVILTLRADFYTHCARYDNLRLALAARQEYLGPMSATEQQRVIEEPVRYCGYNFEAGLADLILRDAGEEPGSLPLLSHALLETWNRRQGRMLTLAGYIEAGGVHGSIARTAELVYSHFTPEQQRIARNIFLHLTELGEGVQDTRRRAKLDELLLRVEDQDCVEEVINLLAEARLLTVSQGSVEVSHEALIREWPTLRNWLAEDREGLRLHRRLTEAAQSWEELGCDQEELYRGAHLAQALEWAVEHLDELNHLEREFLAASSRAVEMENLEREAAHEREIKAAQRAAEAEQQRAEEQSRSAQRFRWLAAGLAVLLALALALTSLVIQQRNQVGEQARLAASRELAASALTNIPIDPERSILLALQALQTAQTKEAEDALHQSVQASRLIRVYHARNPWVIRLVASSDSKLAATSAGPNAEIVTEVWDKNSGQRLLEMPGTLAVGSWPYFDRLATVYVSDGDTTRFTFWDIEALKPVSTVTLDYRFSDSINWEFSPSWEQAAVVMNDGTTRIYDLTSGQLLQTIGKAGLSPGQAVSFSPDGKYLITNVDNITQLWDLSTGQSLFTLTSGNYGANIAQFSPVGERAAFGSESTINITDVGTGIKLLTLYGRVGEIYGIDYNWNGTQLAASGADGKAIVWDAYTGKELMILAGHQALVGDVAFIPFQDQLATGGDDGSVRLWDTSPAGNHEAISFEISGFGIGISYSPDGKRLAVAGGGQEGDIFDAETGYRLITLQPNQIATWIGSISFSPDGNRLASSSGKNDAYIWDADSGQRLMTLSGHNQWIGDLAYSPDGARLATISYDGLVKIWASASGHELLTIRVFTDTIKTTLNLGIDYSPDSSRFATAGAYQPKIWDAHTGELVLALPTQRGAVQCIAFSPDGNYLAIGGVGGLASLWDTASGHKITDLIGHTGSVQAILYSRDGKRVITGNTDGTVKIWEAASGQEQLTLTRQPTRINSLALSPDGRTLAALNFDGTMRIFVLNVDDLIELAKRRLTRGFTPQECQQFLHSENCPPIP